MLDESYEKRESKVFVKDNEQCVTEKLKGIRKEQKLDPTKQSKNLSPSKRMIPILDKHAETLKVSDIKKLKEVAKRSLIIYKNKRLLHS